MNFSSDGKQENVNINNNIQQQINEFPTEREAVEFVCSVLTLNGVRDINPEVFRRGSLGREEVCAKIWKALHDLIIVITLNLKGSNNSQSANDILGQRIDNAWKFIMEKNGSNFKFNTVVFFVLDKLVSFGCPKNFIDNLYKNQNTDGRSLLLALCYVIGKFNILEKHVEQLINRGGEQQQELDIANRKKKRQEEEEIIYNTNNNNVKKNDDDDDIVNNNNNKKKTKMEIDKLKEIILRIKHDIKTYHNVPYLMRQTDYNEEGNNNNNNNNNNETSISDMFSNIPITSLPHVYNEKKNELKFKMCHLKNAHVRYVRAIEKYEVIANQKMTIEDKNLDLTTPLSYGLYIHGRLQKNPKRIERIVKSILLDLNDANYALSCSYVFWKWSNKIIFTNCTDSIIQQCKDRILFKEKERWYMGDEEEDGHYGHKLDHSTTTTTTTCTNNNNGKKQLKIEYVLNHTIQYIEKHLGYDVHFC